VFIVVTHQFADLVKGSIPPWIPVVTQLYHTKMMHPSLEIFFPEIPYNQPSRPGITRRSWLLHSDDLDCYCKTMAYMFTTRVKSSPALCLRSDGTLRDICANEAGQQLSSDHLRLEWCSHRLRETTCELQRSLLSPFSALVGPSPFVSVCGDVAYRLEAEKLELSMRSNLICFRAFGWQTFE
jgi:hypothetical protein